MIATTTRTRGSASHRVDRFFWQRLIAIAVVALLGPWVARTAVADDAPFRKALSEAITTTWGSKPELAKAANEKFSQIDQMAPGDPRALYGHALVLISQRRYDDALRVLDRLLADQDDHLPAWRAKIWIVTLRRNFGASLAACDRSTAILGELGDEGTEAITEHLRFVGRVLGFMEGPAADAAGTGGRGDIEAKIVARLDESQRADLLGAKEDLLVKFSELISARDDSKAVAKAEADETKTKLLQDVAEARVANEKRAEDLQQRRDTLSDQYDAEMKKIADEDAPLLSQITSLESELVAEQSNLSIVNGDISRLQIALSRERDPVIRRQIRFDIDRLAVTSSRLQANVLGIDRQIGVVNGQRATLAARQQSVQNRLGNQVKQIDKELATLGKAEKKLDGNEKQINKPVSLNKGKVLSLNSKAAAWTTYAPFPLLIERDRILGSLE
jgi:tetratricopeptide (TPR) repeat protein